MSNPANNMDEARKLLARAKPFIVGRIGDSKYCEEAFEIRKDIVAFLSKNDLEEAPSNSGAIRDVIAERHKQKAVDGWTEARYDTHTEGELAKAGAAYAEHAARDEDSRQVFSGFPPDDIFPTGWSWRPRDKRRDLVKSAALIIAEIERLDRLGEKRLVFEDAKLPAHLEEQLAAASTSLKEEQREVMPNDGLVSDPLLVTPSPKSEPLAMRACPECKGTGHMSGDGTKGPPHGMCPTCKGTGQVPIEAISDPAINELDAYHFPTEESLVKAAREMCTPTASTESKSLGEIQTEGRRRYIEEYRAEYKALGDEVRRGNPQPTSIEDFNKRVGEAGLQAIESAVSLRYKGEHQRQLDAYYELANVLKETKEQRQQKTAEIFNLKQELASVHATNERLTTLCNENAVLAVEREAEIARKDAVIDFLRDALQAISDHFVKWGGTYSPAKIADDALARLAQKGKS